jgi:hypothetical protein
MFVYVYCIKTKMFNLMFGEKILYEPLARRHLPLIRAFVARALKQALIREHRLPALSS